MEQLRLDRPRSFLAPVDFSCMGYAVPAAIGAALACPGRPVVALPGDGAFLMTGLELLTAAQQGAPVAVFVLRDRQLGQIAAFQARALGRTPCTSLPDYDLVALGRALGVESLALGSDADIEQVVREARAVTATGRPVLVDVAIDASRPTFFTRGVLEANWGRLLVGAPEARGQTRRAQGRGRRDARWGLRLRSRPPGSTRSARPRRRTRTGGTPRDTRSAWVTGSASA
jgi:acetolactate synthase-1/2/3 large subunit